MSTSVHFLRVRLRGAALAATFALAAGQSFTASPALANDECRAPACGGAPYANQPEIAPIGARIDNYMDVPTSARGPAIDPAKGYRTQDLGGGLYMVTENVYQSMFMVHANGVVVIDAPPSLGAYLPKAIAEVTSKSITHVVYSHAHADHIGATKTLGGHPVIVAHEETARLLRLAADPNRPVPDVTFKDKYRLSVGGQYLDLSYHGNGHEPGNIFIHAPRQDVLMVVDVIFPGWMPWRRLALAQDVRGYLDQVEEIRKMDFKALVSGHVARIGTKADVEVQSEFLRDLKAAAGNGLKSTPPGVGLNDKDKANPWAFFDNYIDRVALQCVNTLTPKWQQKLAAFDVFIWDQCFTMEQSLRID